MKAMNEDMIYKLHQNRAGLISLKWTDIYDTEQEIIDDMMQLDANPDNKPMHKLVRGYEFIQSFQRRLEKGIELSDKQIVQLKRLAPSIAYAKYIQRELRKI